MATTSAYAFQEAPMLAELVEKKASCRRSMNGYRTTRPSSKRSKSVNMAAPGSAHSRGPATAGGPTKLMEERVLKFAAGPDGEVKLVPSYIESYSVNDDFTEFTFTLLEGLKWSDGEPVTTEDVSFWYNDIFLNEALTPTFETTLAPGGNPLTVEVKDERTFTVKFEQPYVYFLEILAQDSTVGPSLDRPSFIQPAHYLKKSTTTTMRPKKSWQRFPRSTASKKMDGPVGIQGTDRRVVAE
ncbi:ABC transporter substrate-binding protein [Roseibium salinum]|nr:ABC transporter substrate-binding protein [Roseibium salinum]